MSGTLECNVEKIAKTGYCGIEAPLPPVENAKEFMRTLKTYDLDYIAMIFTSDDHVSSFKTGLKQAAELDPLFVVSHSAKDRFFWQST